MLIFRQVLRDEEVDGLEQHRQRPVVAVVARGHIEFVLGVAVTGERNLREGALSMQIVLIKDIAKVVGLNAEEVDNLAKGCIDLLDRHVNSLRPSEPKARDSRDLINCIDLKHFVYKGRLL